MQIKQENSVDLRWEQKIVFLPLQITNEVIFHKNYSALYIYYIMYIYIKYIFYYIFYIRCLSLYIKSDCEVNREG